MKLTEEEKKLVLDHRAKVKAFEEKRKSKRNVTITGNIFVMDIMTMRMYVPGVVIRNGNEMKLCPDCAPGYTCCDHCAYFDFNGDAEGCYTGDGWCRLHKEKRDPGSDCEEYVCFQLLNPEGVEPKHE